MGARLRRGWPENGQQVRPEPRLALEVGGPSANAARYAVPICWFVSLGTTVPRLWRILTSRRRTFTPPGPVRASVWIARRSRSQVRRGGNFLNSPASEKPTEMLGVIEAGSVNR